MHAKSEGNTGIEFADMLINKLENVLEKNNNYANFKISLALIRGISWCMIGIRIKINRKIFESKDIGGYELLLY